MNLKRKDKGSYIVIVALMILVNLGPILYAFMISITPEYEIFSNKPNLLPAELTLDNYRNLFNLDNHQSLLFFEGVKNSLLSCMITLLLGVPCAILTAYTLSRYQFRFKKAMQNALLYTMVIPVFATIIPLFTLYSRYNLLDHMFWLSLVYVSAYLPISAWMLMNQFNSIPRELEEAAQIDGCSKLGILFRVIIPLSKPTILSVILIIFLQTWNQFQIPLILASSRVTKPMAIIITEFATKSSEMFGLTAAAGIIAILPPAILAILFRKYLMGDLVSGGMK